MSLNLTLNAILALVEGEPDKARQYFRDPQSDVKDPIGVVARLYSALDKRTATELRTLLIDSLTARPDESMSSEYQEGFYEGVVAMEHIIESRIEELCV